MNSQGGRPILDLSRDRLAAPALESVEGISLFLDLDGTLLELVDRPDQVVADAPLKRLLARLDARLGGRLAVVSGRSIAQIDRILGDLARRIAVSGSHGSEHRWRDIHAHPVRPAAFDRVAEQFRAFADAHPGVLVEDKAFGVALHYRMAPRAGPAALALARDMAARHDLQLQPGRMMAELRLAGGDKGTAVRMLMERAPMAGTRPVFVGDDLTDEPAFEAACAYDGFGILIGDRQPTAARYGLPDPAALRAWLAMLAA